MFSFSTGFFLHLIALSSRMKLYSKDPSLQLSITINPSTMSLKGRHLPAYLQFRSKTVTTFMMVVILLTFWKNIIHDAFLATSKNSVFQKPKESLDPITNQTLGVRSLRSVVKKPRLLTDYSFKKSSPLHLKTGRIGSYHFSRRQMPRI